MAIALQHNTFQQDILEGLRNMARQQAPLQDMVCFVQKELGFSSEFIVPVLGYFCQAFSLPLRDVLPLREWVQIHDDRMIAVLLQRLRAEVA